MDITPTLNQSLKAHDVGPIKPSLFNLASLNSFLKEAYRINSHISELTSYLRSIRSPYLALQPHRSAPAYRKRASRVPDSELGDSKQQLTDVDRARVDSDTKAILTTISRAIRDLSNTAKLESELSTQLAAKKRSKRGLGSLGRWAAGGGETAKSPEEIEVEGKVEGLRRHREAIIWFLSRRLESVGDMQRQMIEIRVQREIERSKSILHTVATAGSMRSPNAMSSHVGFGGDVSPSAARAVELEKESEGQRIEDELSPEQVQMFEREQGEMLRHYNSELQKIRAAESSLLEISSLQTELVTNLEIQSESISQLVEDSYLTTDNLGSGNKQLRKATERPSTARMVFWATCALCTTLVVWDLII